MISKKYKSSNINANSTFSNFTKLKTEKFKKFGKLKAKSDLRLYPNSKRFLPLLTTEKNLSNFINSVKSSQELQRTLSFNKNKMRKNKSDLRDLKLQYLKLHEENENNTKILANILKLDNSVLKSKEKILEKIKQSKLGQEKEIIMDSMNIIDLKLELNEKKSILKSKEYEYNILKENSKYKNFIEMKKQLTNNSGIKNEIISDLEKIKSLLSENKKIKEKKEEEFKKLSQKYKEIKSKENNISEEKRKNKGKYVILKELISKLEEKLHNQEIRFKRYCKEKMDLINSIKDKEDIVNEIKEYLSKREQIIAKLQKRKDIIKNLEKQIFEIENEFNKLSEVNFGLSKQIEKNENIFKKLDKKYKDDRKEKSNMMLENNLKKIKLDLENIKNEFQIKIKKLKEINNKNIEDIQKNKNIIDVKRDLLNKLEKKKNRLELELENSGIKLKDIENEINDKKKELELLKNEEIKKRNETNNDKINKDIIENENDKDKSLNNGKTEQKSEIQKLKEQTKLKSENENHIINTEKN